MNDKQGLGQIGYAAYRAYMDGIHSATERGGWAAAAYAICNEIAPQLPQAGTDQGLAWGGLDYSAKSMSAKPSLGDIVIYHASEGHDLAAIVQCRNTHPTSAMSVNLSVFASSTYNPVQMQFNVHHGTGIGGWSWPERVA